jgi:tetratricopeptide (TPR) repeat protein
MRHNTYLLLKGSHMANPAEKYSFIREKLNKVLSREELAAVEQDYDQLIDLGFEFVEHGEYRKAYDLFVANMQVSGSSPDAVNGLAISLAEMGETDKALDVMTYAARLYPEDGITIANLASIYWDKFDYDKAIYYYTKSIEINPELIDSYFNLVNIYYESGDILMAYLAASTLVQKFPDDEQALQAQNDILLDMAISMY